jgi:putative membrane protein
MIVKLLVAWVILAAAIAITAALVPSVEVDGGVLTLLGVSMLFALVNALLGPLLRLISLPLTLITLDVGGVMSTIIAALVISVVTAVLWFLIDRVFDGSRPAHSAQA